MKSSQGSVSKAQICSTILDSGKAHFKLQGLASPALDRRNKYRPRNCNGDATSRFKLKNIAKQTIEFRSVCGRYAR